MVSESVRLGSPSTPEIDLVQIFTIKISISSKKPPTPGWLGVPKMHLTRIFLLDKAFYQSKKLKNTENRSFSILFKIPKLFILFAPENRFLIEVRISTKKNLKAEMPNFPTKFSETFFPGHVTFAGGYGQPL